MSDSTSSGSHESELPVLSDEQEMKAKVIRETAKIPWHDLQTYFAKGQVVNVAAELDLVEVAMKLNKDDVTAFSQWKDAGLIGEVEVSLAQQWYDANQKLWAVVVMPWVLVQDKQ